MELNAFIDTLMHRAIEAGAEAAEVYVQTGDSARISIFDGAVAESRLAASHGLSFRVLKNGRMGYASTESLDDEALSMLVSRALDNAATVESDDQQFMYAGKGEYPQVQNAYDASLEAFTPAKLIQMSLALEKAALTCDDRVLRLSNCTGYRGEGSVRIVNTLGLDVSFKENLAYFYPTPVVKDGEGMTSGGAFWAGNQAEKADMDQLAREAVDDALAYVGAKPLPSGRYRAILRKEAMAELLSAFASVFSAENAQKGLSRLAGREGEEIASAAVTVLDDPLLERGYASRPFDDEGVPTSKKSVIDNGRLTTLLHNLKTANKQGITTTGNASKAGYTSPVSVSPFNFYVQPGEKSYAQLLEQMGDGIVIAELSGLHAGTNAVSGDFSLIAKGYWAEGGKIIRPLSQITVAGNWYTLLKEVLSAGSDLYFDLPGNSAFGSPSVLVEGLSVAGE